MTTDEIKKFLGEVKDTSIESLDKVKRMDHRVSELEYQIQQPVLPNGGGTDIGLAGFKDYVTPGRRLIDAKDGLELLRKTNHVRFQIGALWPSFENKTLIDSGSLGLSTPGILNAERVSDIVPQPRRRLTVRDLLRSRRITGGADRLHQRNWIHQCGIAAGRGSEQGRKCHGVRDRI